MIIKFAKRHASWRFVFILLNLLFYLHFPVIYLNKIDLTPIFIYQLLSFVENLFVFIPGFLTPALEDTT